MKKTAECAIQCNEPIFRAYLKYRLSNDTMVKRSGIGERWLPVRDKDQAASAIRYLLKIKSRAELNTDDDAGERWNEFYQDFKLWKAGIHG